MPIYSKDTLSKITALDGVLAAYAVCTASPHSQSFVGADAFVGDESLLPVIKACEWLASFPVTPRPEPKKPARARAMVGGKTLVVTQYVDARVVVVIPTGSPAAKSLNRSVDRLHRGGRTRPRPSDEQGDKV